MRAAAACDHRGIKKNGQDGQRVQKISVFSDRDFLDLPPPRILTKSKKKKFFKPPLWYADFES